jgi:hypothetical protein
LYGNTDSVKHKNRYSRIFSDILLKKTEEWTVYMGQESESLLRRLQKTAGPAEVILDTDTFNEIDDQYALAFLVKSGDKLRIRGIHAALYVYHINRNRLFGALFEALGR